MSCPLIVWKEEPESPLSYNEGSLEATFYQTPLEEFGAKLEADLAYSDYEEKAEVTSQDAHENIDDEDEVLADLEELIDLDLKELIKNGKSIINKELRENKT